ncbi:MAG: Flp family type IVb pilin [Planctomycetes bacterium]|nr:Flp family type IVb pilin [Planctomycetota bacterium]
MKDLNPVTVNPIVNRKKQRGQSMAEYAIIISLIALVCIGAITLFGKEIKSIFTEATEKMQDRDGEDD